MNICHTLARKFQFYKHLAAGGGKFDSVPDGCEYYVMGSTNASFDYDFDVIRVNGFNAAVAPQSVSYDYRLLEQYHNKIKPGGTVIWSPICFVLCVGEYEQIGNHLRYYYVLDKQRIYNANRQNELCAVVCPVFNFVKYSIRKLVCPIIRIFKHKVHCIGNTKNSIASNTSTLEVSAMNYYNGWRSQFNFNENNVSQLLDINERIQYSLSYLNKIIRLCSKNNLKFMIVIPPVSRTMMKYIKQPELERYLLRYLKALDSKIPVWNYFGDELFSNDDLFETAISMNENGRKLFTREIIARIEASKA